MNTICIGNNIQKLKTWDFASKFAFKKTKIDYFHKNKPTYDSKMKELGAWTKKELIDLGPTFIKLGQVASSRQDVFSEGFTSELETLQDECPPIQDQNIIQMVESELNSNLHEVFESFDTQPYKAASIGQVHNARLKNGIDVVVKVQRPNISNIILNDLKTVREIFGVFTFLRLLSDFDENLLQESEKYLMQEVDYINEARNAKIFRTQFYDDTNYIVPRVCSKYSTKKLLVMERVKGRKITELHKDESKKTAVKLIIECFIQQLVEYGYIHGDPHPGNLAYNKGDLILYDFGLVIDVSTLVRDSFDDIIISLIQKDSKRLTEILIDSKLIFPTSSKPNIVFFFDSLFEMFGTVSVDDTDFDLGESMEVLNDLGFSDSNRPFTISNDLIYLGKSLSLLDGICRHLDPDYKPLSYIQPYVEDRLEESSINIEGALTNIIEIPSKIKNINSSIISIEKTAYSMKAKTKTIKRDVQQTQMIMFAFIMYFLYIQ